MHISCRPLWHTLIERSMRKEDLRFAASMTINIIVNMGKEGKHISMDTLARICETLDCGIMDVIELVSDEPSTTGGNDNGKTERKNHRADESRRGSDRGTESPELVWFGRPDEQYPQPDRRNHKKQDDLFVDI